MHKGIVAATICACIAFSPWTSLHATEVKDCGLKRYASIDLAVGGDGYLLVPVIIQGARAYMILNMATALTSVTEGAARNLSLQVKPIPAQVGVHAGKDQVRQMATATPFIVDKLQFRNATFLVLPQSSFRGPTADPPVVGILGMDVFKELDIELDVAHRKMNIFSTDHCPGHPVYWSAKYDSAPIRFGTLGEVYFPMELDGKKLETTLATSNAMTTLSTDATRKLFNFDSHSSDIETETDSSGRTTAHYRAMKLSGQGLDIINARISLIDRPAGSACQLTSRFGVATYEGCFGIHPLALGQNVVSKLHLYIATKEKMIYFTPADPSE